MNDLRQPSELVDVDSVLVYEVALLFVDVNTPSSIVVLPHILHDSTSEYLSHI